MYRLRYGLFIFLLLSRLVATAQISPVRTTPPLIYGLVPDYEPITFVSDDGRPTGLYIELFSRIMDELGYQYEFFVGSFSEIYPKLLSGEIHLYSNVFRTEPRENDFYWPAEPTATGWSTLFVKTGTVLTDIREIHNQKIGLIWTDGTGHRFIEYMNSLQILFDPVFFETYEEMADAVRNDEVMGAVGFNFLIPGTEGVSSTPVVFAPSSGYTTTGIAAEDWVKDAIDTINHRFSQLRRQPDSYYYELQNKWLFSNIIETTVWPAWILPSLISLGVAAIVFLMLIRILTRQLRQANTALTASNLNLEDRIRATSQELIRAEMKNTTAQLVAGVAHEINTPIGVVLTSASFLKDIVDELRIHSEAKDLTKSTFDERCRQMQSSVEVILFNTSRAIALIGSFKKLSADQFSSESQRVNLREYLEMIVTSVQPEFRNKPIEIRTDLEDIIVEISVEAVAVSVVNIFMNALVHGFENGTRGGFLRIICRRVNGDCLIEIANNGRRIPEAAAARMFDAFFTTNRAGGNSGLGLSIVKTAVEDSLGGSIKVTSTDETTVFSLRFPLRTRA